MTRTDPPTTQGRVGLRTLLWLAGVSGILLWLAFASNGWLSFFAFVALAPLGLFVRLPARLSHLYLAAYFGGWCFFGPGLYWVGTAGPNWWQACLMRAALIGYCALYFPAFVFFSRILHREWNLPAILVLPAVWTALEYLRVHLLTGFGWLLLGHSVWRWTWTIQIADLAGVYAVSFYIAFVNAALLEVLLHPLMRAGKFDPTGALTWRLRTAVVAVVAVLVYGGYRTGEGETVKRPGPKVVLLHANLRQSIVDGDPEADAEKMKALADAQTEVAADMLVYPETSLAFGFYGAADEKVPDLELARMFIARDVPGGPNDDFPLVPKLGERLRDLLDKNRRDLLQHADDQKKAVYASLFRRDFRSGGYFKFNSSVLFAPAKGLVGYYDKVHLVPFGEYLPLKSTIPQLRYLTPHDAAAFGLDHAENLRAVQYDKLHFGTLICFEDTVPWIARAFARQPERVEFLVSQCNDGWFPLTREAEYHLAAGLFRCVENRLPMVRATIYGVTGLVDGNGRLRETAPIDKMGALTVEVPLDGRTTVYMAWGDWLPTGCMLLTAGYLIATLAVLFRRVGARLSGRSNKGPSA